MDSAIVSGGDCNTRRKTGVKAKPTIVRTMPDIIQKAIAVPVAFCMDSSSFGAEKLCYDYSRAAGERHEKAYQKVSYMGGASAYGG